MTPWNLEKFYAHGVSKTFVLRQISLEVEEGEFLSIMGPSGAGKSTLLHMLGMHDSDWTGEFEFAGYPVHAMKPKHRAKLHKQYIGFVFQSYHLLDDLTVLRGRRSWSCSRSSTRTAPPSSR